jgi:hypothetical protein
MITQNYSSISDSDILDFEEKIFAHSKEISEINKNNLEASPNFHISELEETWKNSSKEYKQKNIFINNLSEEEIINILEDVNQEELNGYIRDTSMILPHLIGDTSLKTKVQHFTDATAYIDTVCDVANRNKDITSEEIQKFKESISRDGFAEEWEKNNTSLMKKCMVLTSTLSKDNLIRIDDLTKPVDKEILSSILSKDELDKFNKLPKLHRPIDEKVSSSMATYLESISFLTEDDSLKNIIIEHRKNVQTERYLEDKAMRDKKTKEEVKVEMQKEKEEMERYLEDKAMRDKKTKEEVKVEMQKEKEEVEIEVKKEWNGINRSIK